MHRVLVVDDSLTVRTLLTAALGDTPDIQVVSVAASGAEGIAKLPQSKPDVVVLDVEMPGLTGLATLRAIRTLKPNLPVIMFSATTKRGAKITLEALALGAADYVTKPKTWSLEGAQESVKRELAAKIRGLCLAARRRPKSRLLTKSRPPPVAPIADPQIVVVGTSTGGPRALAKLLGSLPANFPVPMVVAQHMPPLFTASLAAGLDRKSSMRVAEAKGGETPKPGEVWIAPGGKQLRLVGVGVFATLDVFEPTGEQFAPSVDVLFHSVARSHRADALALVLSGMGNDGLAGCRAISQAGGRIVVQDEESSTVWGMPGSVAREGLADRVVAINSMDLALLHALESSERLTGLGGAA